MDDVDAKQEAAIEQLREHARDNRTTDAWQWLGLAVVAFSLVLYVSLLLGSTVRLQGASIQSLVERCGK